MVLTLFSMAATMSLICAEERIDFEGVSDDLPGWSAMITEAGSPVQYRPAVKWDVPFTISLDSEKPHDGSTALKLAFSAEVQGNVSLRPPTIMVTGTAATISFFVRCEGLAEEPLFSFEETSADGQKVKSHWGAAKIPLSEEWMELKWSGPLQPATASVRISIICKSPHAGARMWIDDIVVEPIEGE